MIQKYKIICLYTVVFLILTNNCNLLAQDEDESLTKGTEFWLTYLPNYHNNAGNSLSRNDSLFVLIAAEEVTNGIIEYRDYRGKKYTHNFIITNPDEVYRFGIPWIDFELQGFNNSQDELLYKDSQNETPSSNSFKITTDKGVNVYAHSEAVTTSEACTVYPLESLDNEYFVLTYYSDGSSDGWSGISTQSTPSQYAIVAPYDNTQIEITNSVMSWDGNSLSQSITLNKGEVYLVQARISSGQLNSDLSGSKIESNQPIAVFSGQQRAKVPRNSGLSRDMLYEQIPSKRSLGKEYIITPFNQPSSITNKSVNDRYRIMALEDNTSITINNSSNINLDAGEYHEADILNPMYIKADKKIIAAVYKKTAQRLQGDFSDSDPFMMFLPPVEKYSNQYKFLNIQVNWNAYTNQYITVITDNKNFDEEAFTLDGNRLTDKLFTSIAGTKYSYANISVNDGNHKVEGVYKFTVLVYGYGHANSYAYFAGMNYKGDQVTPEFQSGEECFLINGIVTDSTYLDTGIKSVNVINNSSYNTTTTIDPISEPAKVVGFKTELVNKYQDGAAVISATDSSGISSQRTFEIKGFTVTVKGTADYTDANIEYMKEDTAQYLTEICYPITLHNYGKFPQEISDITLTNLNEYYINTTLPITIAPNEDHIIDICMTGQKFGIYDTDIIIGNLCTERPVASLTTYVLGDDVPPSITTIEDECFDLIDVKITDSLKLDIGIAKVNIIDSYNCDIRVRSETPHVHNIAIYIVDKKQDAYYHIEAIDSSGNSSEVEGFIQGFTLEFGNEFVEEPGNSSLNINFGEQVVGDRVCDTITVMNYGSKEFVIDKPRFSEHIYFSTPETGFPIVLQPGETGEFPVCFRSIAVKDQEYTDTLFFGFHCEEFKIPLRAISDTLYVNSEGRCEVPVELTITEVPDDYFVMQNYPNPFDISTIITVGAPAKGNMKIDIYNMYGELVRSIVDIDAIKGIYKFEFNKNDLPQGVYFYDVRMNEFREVRKMIIQ